MEDKNLSKQHSNGQTKRTPEQTNSILQALTGDAMYRYEFDVTTGIVNMDIATPDGLSFSAMMGLSVPFDFDTLSEKSEAIGMTCRRNKDNTNLRLKHLQEAWECGERKIETTIRASALGVFHSLTFLLYPDEATGHVRALALARDISDRVQMEAKQLEDWEMIRKRAEEIRIESLEVLSALSRDYLNIFLLDLDREDFEILKMEGYVQRGLTHEMYRRFPYAKTVEDYLVDRVYPEDREMMAQEMSVENLRSRMKAQAEYAVPYRTVNDEGEIVIYQVKYIRVENTHRVIVGFLNINDYIVHERQQNQKLSDALVKEKQLNQRLEAQNNINAGLAELYHTAYYADLENDTYRVIKSPVEVQQALGGAKSNDEVIRLFLDYSVSPEYRERVRAFTDLSTIAERLKDTDVISMEYHGRNVDWIRANWIAARRSDRGTVTHAIFTVEIISDLVKERMHQQQLLSEALEEARRANAAKSAFLARMSHDIRTPLNGIIGLIDINEKHHTDTALLDENRRKARVAVSHLMSLINDVLELSKMDDQQVTLAYEPFNLLDLTADVLTITSMRAAEAGITLIHQDCSSHFRKPYVYGSPLHVRQIMLNILGNCIKYNRPGGSVSCSARMVQEMDDKVVYQCVIEDTGIGMSPEFLEHIFEPFTQERQDARSVYQGTGLGMAIVKSLLDKMGGNIEITSTVGVGTKFIVNLPFDVAEAEKVVVKRPVQNADISDMNILLVEDNELNMEIAETLLEDCDVRVTEAWNGQEALELIRDNPPGTFDVVLMDIMMPVMDGIAATRAIRALDRPDAKTLPILAMTANAFAEDKRKCLDAGMDDHLAKPLDIKKLVAVLAEYK